MELKDKECPTYLVDDDELPVPDASAVWPIAPPSPPNVASDHVHVATFWTIYDPGSGLSANIPSKPVGNPPTRKKKH